MLSAKRPLAFPLLASVLLLYFAGCVGAFASFLGHAKLSTASNGRYQDQRRINGEVTWCIAKPSTEDERLNLNIDYSCRQSGVDCKPIQPGGSCCNPDNTISHASFAMNLFYKSAGKNYWNCHFSGTSLIITQNPSVGACNYPV